MRDFSLDDLTDAVITEYGRTDDPRFREIMTSLIRHLHDFVREVKLTEVVRESFREVHDGFSADEVLVRDDLNAAFIGRCRKSLPDADETQLNWKVILIG